MPTELGLARVLHIRDRKSGKPDLPSRALAWPVAVRNRRTKKAPPAKANGAKSREETPKRGGGRRPTYRHHRSLGDLASIDGTWRPQREAAHTPQSVLVCA